MPAVLRSRSWSLLLLTLIVVLAPAAASAQRRPLAVNAEAVLLLDPSGKILFAKNADHDRAPASLVKLMTLYLAGEDLEAGRVDLDEMVTVSAHAAATPKYRMGLRAGQEVPLHVLLEGVAIASANDAATALAERLAGDEGTFVARMNDKAKELGLTATRFANPHGLPDPLQRSNARDLAELTGRLIQDYAMVRPLLGGQTFIWNGRVYARHIPLFKDPGGVQALKTGFTHEAGYNLAVSAWRAGQQYLMIVLGARTRAHSFLDAKKVLHYGFVESGIEPPDTPKPARPTKRPIRTRRAKTSGS
jgi:D-alanyl-D-alanine carboxypeptidase